MTRAVVRLLPAEMALLGLFELLASFLAIHGVLTTTYTKWMFRSAPDPVALPGLLAVIVTAGVAAIGLYRSDICLNRRRLFVGGMTAGMLLFPLLLAVAVQFHMRMNGETISWTARLVAVWMALVVAIRILLTRLWPSMSIPRRVMIVGTGERAERLRLRLLNHQAPRFQPMDAPPERPSPGSRPTLMPGSRPTLIVLAEDDTGGSPWRRPVGLRGVPVITDVTFQETRLGRIEPRDGDRLLRLDGRRDRMLARGVKRACDIAISLCLLAATAPLLLVMAVLIKCDSPGPVFYRQTRVGLRGRVFTLLKLRSMTRDAEAAGVARWAQTGDPRVTRVGRFMRETRIDELPQLLNVLRGEMSIVGPRPERPMFVDELAKQIPGYGHRAMVKPGLTGWAQVNFPYGASVEDAWEKLAYDLYYVKNGGLLLDMMIMLSTVRVVVFREGAR